MVDPFYGPPGRSTRALSRSVSLLSQDPNTYVKDKSSNFGLALGAGIFCIISLLVLSSLLLFFFLPQINSRLFIYLFELFSISVIVKYFLF